MFLSKNFSYSFPKVSLGRQKQQRMCTVNTCDKINTQLSNSSKYLGGKKKDSHCRKLIQKERHLIMPCHLFLLTSLGPDMFLLHPIYDRDRCRFRFEAIRNCSFVKWQLAPSDVHMFLTGFYPMLNDSAQC